MEPSSPSPPPSSAMSDIPYSQMTSAQKQRARKQRSRFRDVERIYFCNFRDCTKGYGRLNHLNDHIKIQNHGEVRKPSEFVLVRKQLKRRRLQEEILKETQVGSQRKKETAKKKITNVNEEQDKLQQLAQAAAAAAARSVVTSVPDTSSQPSSSLLPPLNVPSTSQLPLSPPEPQSVINKTVQQQASFNTTVSSNNSPMVLQQHQQPPRRPTLLQHSLSGPIHHQYTNRPFSLARQEPFQLPSPPTILPPIIPGSNSGPFYGAIDPNYKFLPQHRTLPPSLPPHPHLQPQIPVFSLQNYMPHANINNRYNAHNGIAEQYPNQQVLYQQDVYERRN